MQPIQVDDAGDRRLRFVFGGSVVSFSLGANAVFEEVARRLDEPRKRYSGDPVAIDVALAAARKESGGCAEL
jgi:hypothetical protein